MYAAYEQVTGGQPWRRYFASASHLDRDRDWREFARECCRADDGTPAPSPAPEPRELDLLRANRDRWLAGLPASVTFDRGLPQRLELPAWEYLSHADELCRHSPVLSVGLTDYEGLKAHHNPGAIKKSWSYMDPASSELHRSCSRLGRIVDEHMKRKRPEDRAAVQSTTNDGKS